MKGLLVVVALVAVACAPTQPQPATAQQGRVVGTNGGPNRRPLFAEVLLPSDTIPAGSSVRGRVLVHNDTGHALRATGCLSLFAVALRTPTIKPPIAWPTCLERFTIPRGPSTYPVTVRATYSSCPPCVLGRPAPLPPGEYRAVLFQSSRIVPAPPPVAIRVVP